MTPMMAKMTTAVNTPMPSAIIFNSFGLIVQASAVFSGPTGNKADMTNGGMDGGSGLV